MSEEVQETRLNFTDLTVEIVSAYISNNPIPPAELPLLIVKVHQAVSGLAAAGSSDAAVGGAAGADVARPSAAQIRKSIRDDGLISFIDGKAYKTLKRHLTAHGLDPRAYRERYSLPSDYPMTAPSYAAQRSALAKATGLGSPGRPANQRNARKSA